MAKNLASDRAVFKQTVHIEKSGQEKCRFLAARSAARNDKLEFFNKLLEGSPPEVLGVNCIVFGIVIPAVQLQSPGSKSALVAIPTKVISFSSGPAIFSQTVPDPFIFHSPPHRRSR